MRVNIEGQERYPVYRVSPIEDETRVYKVDDDLVIRAERAEAEFAECQKRLRQIVDPPCPECRHPGSRHQVAGKDNTWYEEGTTYCLFRDHEAPEGSQRCRCTLPQPSNPNLVTHA